MKFRNPPVTEIWIDIEFAPVEGVAAITADDATDYIKSCPGDLQPAEPPTFNTHLQITARAGGGWDLREPKAPTFAQLRGRTADQTWWLQVRPNRFIINQVRQPGFIPSYSGQRDRALDYLVRYIERFQPQKVQRAWLNYQNLIVPPPLGSEDWFRPNEYFRVNLEVPEESFGAMARYAFEAQWPEQRIEGGQGHQFDVMRVTFQSRPPIPYVPPPNETGSDVSDGDGEGASDIGAALALDSELIQFQFLMTWNGICEGVGPADPEAIFRRLDTVHERLVTWFAQCFTAEGLRMFDPEENA